MWAVWLHKLTKIVECNSFEKFSPLQRSVLSYLLLPSLSTLSRFYELLQRAHFKRQRQRVQTLGIRCISVGNITAGGNGKTPFCEYLGKSLSKNCKVVIVGNGYSSDEEKLLQFKLRKHSVIVKGGKNRIQIVEREKECNPDLQTVILDDGFQSVSIHRDCDLLIINALNPFSNYSLIPRGTLREPLAALARAHIFLLNHSNFVTPLQLHSIQKTINSYKPGAKIFQVKMQPTHLFSIADVDRVIELDYIAKKRIVAFSGIAQALSFHLSLRSLGAEIVDVVEFPDHHIFTQKELKTLQRVSVEKNALLVTTEKDYFRCSSTLQSILSSSTLVLSASIQFIQSESDFHEELQKILDRKKTQN